MRDAGKETLEEKIRRVLKDEIAVEEYNPDWPRWFKEEKDRLRDCLPEDLVGRIEAGRVDGEHKGELVDDQQR